MYPLYAIFICLLRTMVLILYYLSNIIEDNLKCVSAGNEGNTLFIALIFTQIVQEKARLYRKSSTLKGEHR